MIRLLVLAALFVSACAPLSKHDSVLGDAGEIAGRTLLCPLTLCLSEAYYADEWEKQQQQQRYSKWYDALTPEQQAIEDQRAHERALAATRALGMALSRGPILQPIPVRPILPPITVMQPPTMPTYRAPQRLNCTTQMIGNQVYTNCY